MANSRNLLRALREQGWTVEQTSQGHWCATPPDPDEQIVHFSDSEDPHAFRNIIAELRRKGFKWPWKKPKARVNGEAPDEDEAPRTTEELLTELTEARDYFYLAADDVEVTQQALSEAKVAFAEALEELETAKRMMRKAKAAFDEAFELPDVGPESPPRSTVSTQVEDA